MSRNFAVIRNDTIENVVVWDGGDDWSPPDGATVHSLPEGAGVGWRFVGGEWTAPEPMPSEEAPD